MSQIIPYTHYKQNLYGPDLNDKTCISTVNWLTFRGELMSFGASTAGSKETTVADTASKLVIPNLYNDKGVFPPSGIQLNVSQVTNTFKAAKDVV
jgi:plastocyanin domain-containing protein